MIGPLVLQLMLFAGESEMLRSLSTLRRGHSYFKTERLRWLRVGRFDPRFPGPFLEVSLCKTLNPKLSLVVNLAPHIATAVISVAL